jgi:hypothetical protein
VSRKEKSRALLWTWGVLLLPSSTFAVEPPAEVLLIPPFLGMIVVTALGWLATRLLNDFTARYFVRVLLLGLLWTPVPVISLQNFSFNFMFSGIYIASFWWTRNSSQSPYLIAEAARTHLNVAIAVGVVCVLGGIVVLARSLAHLRQARAQRLDVSAK